MGQKKIDILVTWLFIRTTISREMKLLLHFVTSLRSVTGQITLILQNKYGRRPLIFTTNGFEFFYTNDFMGYPGREVSGFFTQEELQLEMDGRKQRIPLENIKISDEITNRPYQKEAVTAVCDAIKNKHRKMLIVQATGSGKTRVSISIVDVLRRHNYVKNILFLADRTALVKQAINNYSNLLLQLPMETLMTIRC